MPISRRRFIGFGAATAVGTLSPLRTFPSSAYSTSDIGSDGIYPLLDPDVMRTLAMRGIDAARQAGATYADIRLTRIVRQQMQFRKDDFVGAAVGDLEQFGIGIRALIDGYWGFSASPYWEADETVRLAQEAVRMARTNASGGPRVIEWGKAPIATGSWTMPAIDPFSIPIEEKIDFAQAWRQEAQKTRLPGVFVSVPDGSMDFYREERYLATTEGTAVQQTTFRTEGQFAIEVRPAEERQAYERGMFIQGLGAQGKGWEVFLDANIREQTPLRIAEGAELIKIPEKPTEIGRFDMIFDSSTTGALIAKTFGVATQLDRALGYESNAGGTSYLGPDPLEILGHLKVASSQVTLTANRSMPGGLATVKWDDEGIEPQPFTLVRDGTLRDYQTTREQAAWLAPWYTKQKTPIRSHGCAGASSAFGITLQCPPNLSLEPASTSTASFDDLVSSMEKGIAVIGGVCRTDFQARNGLISGGMIREVNNGKMGAILVNTGCLFNSHELWNSLTALGGEQSVEHRSSGWIKGQPQQGGYFTVSTVPVAVKQASVIDISRRA